MSDIKEGEQTRPHTRRGLNALRVSWVVVALVLSMSASPVGASGQPPFTQVLLPTRTTAVGEPFVVTGLDCSYPSPPYVQPTGQLVFVDETTGVALGTVDLTPDVTVNCGTASVTDTESLPRGVYVIKATYIPGGAQPVAASPPAINFEKVTGSTATATCKSPQPCDVAAAYGPLVTAPGLSVAIDATPTGGTGTVNLDIAAGTLRCPNLAPTRAPVADVTDTKFKFLTITATHPLTSTDKPSQVCFHSTVPFKSQSTPINATAGTALLLNCTQVANVPPCVRSSKQVGSTVTVTFVIEGGDPLFTIVLPTGREAWASHLGHGKVGAAYSAHFQTKGGKAPFKWNVASGNLPPGCTQNPTTGTITGKPTKAGTYKAEIQAADAENPHMYARLPVPFTIS